MTLKNWRNKGWLKAHKADGNEIRNLLGIADRDLKDCRAKGISADWRLNIAYNAALQTARAALAASGYRASGEGHHFRVIQSLDYTVGWDKKSVNRLDAFRKKRNISDYDMAGRVSEAEVKEMTELAKKLREDVETWLYSKYPELMD